MQHSQTRDQRPQHDPQSEKKAWTSPKLEEFGAVAELTLVPPFTPFSFS